MRIWNGRISSLTYVMHLVWLMCFTKMDLLSREKRFSILAVVSVQTVEIRKRDGLNCVEGVFELFDILRGDSCNEKNVNDITVEHCFTWNFFLLNKQLLKRFHQKIPVLDWTTSKWNELHSTRAIKAYKHEDLANETHNHTNPCAVWTWYPILWLILVYFFCTCLRKHEQKRKLTDTE